MVNRTYVISILVGTVALAFPAIARADDPCAGCANRDPHDAVSEAANTIAKPPARIGLYGEGGFGPLTRPTDTQTGMSLAGELGVAFDGVNGVRAGFTSATGIIGPDVRIYDVDYSHQWNTSPFLRGVTGSFGVLVGPSLADVSYGGDQPDRHFAFGGRAGAFADLNLWMFTLGADASYRIGFSNVGYESMAIVGLHAGVTFALPAPRSR